ncbi:MAG: NADH-quinone oxidoreductase subunit NuoB [Campylobacterota bacterium]|nr:NADH-quinone oxidoreductase subunit NuoB [Campylobacterota bacterium]
MGLEKNTMEEGFIDYQKVLNNEEHSIKSTQNVIQKAIDWFTSRSMFVLAYGTGCGAIEMPPTFTSRYDIERLGVVGVATPRQADILIVSGYCSFKTLKRVIRSYEQMNEPKYIIALGSCTINGGMYWDSYNTIKKLDEYLPVDMYVNGCMPRPEALIEGFIKLQEKIKNGNELPGYKKYTQNKEFYTSNQSKLFGKKIAPSYEANFAGMNV